MTATCPYCGVASDRWPCDCPRDGRPPEVCADCGAESWKACPWNAGTCSECSAARERSVAGTADPIPPCEVHPYYPDPEHDPCPPDPVGCECPGCDATWSYHAGLCPWCIEACTAGEPHVPFQETEDGS